MPELDEKREEAIVEAVLFTMGKSVELRQLAAALGTDTERAEAAVRRLQSRYEAEKAGHADHAAGGQLADGDPRGIL